MINFAWLLSLDVSAMVLKYASVAVPPNNSLQTPWKNLIWGCFEKRDACLPACLPHRGPPTPYSFMDSGWGLTQNTQAHTHTHKESPSLGVETCRVLAGLHCQGKKQRHTTEFPFMAQRFHPPVDSPLRSKKIYKKKSTEMAQCQIYELVLQNVLCIYYYAFKKHRTSYLSYSPFASANLLLLLRAVASAVTTTNHLPSSNLVFCSPLHSHWLTSCPHFTESRNLLQAFLPSSASFLWCILLFLCWSSSAHMYVFTFVVIVWVFFL